MKEELRQSPMMMEGMTSVQDRDVIACALAYSACFIMLGCSTLAAVALKNSFIETMYTLPWLLPTATASPPQNVTAVSGAGPILAESKSVSKQTHRYHRPVYVHVPWCSAQPRRRSHRSNPKNKTEIRL